MALKTFLIERLLRGAASGACRDFGLREVQAHAHAAAIRELDPPALQRLLNEPNRAGTGFMRACLEARHGALVDAR